MADRQQHKKKRPRENVNANAVGVGCVRCARAHLSFGLRGAPAQLFVVAVGSAPNRSQRAIRRDCQNAPRGRTISLTWTHFSSHGRYLESRTRGLQSGREGRGWGSGAGHCRRFLPSPMLQPPRGALQWRSCCFLLLPTVAACDGPRIRSWGPQNRNMHDLPSCAARDGRSLVHQPRGW